MAVKTDQLYQVCLQKEKEAGWKASIFGLMNTLINVIVLISGMIVLTLSPSSYEWKNTALLIIGAVISTLKTLSITVDFHRKAIIFEQISIKMRRLVRTLVSADPEQVGKMMDQLYKEFDDLDLSLFSESILGDAVTSPINSNDRELHRNDGYVAVPQESNLQIHVTN